MFIILADLLVAVIVVAILLLNSTRISNSAGQDYGKCS
jgi:hypothetical protein